MVMINTLAEYVDDCVEGIYRLSQIKSETGPHGQSKMVATLEDCSGKIVCYGWKFNSHASCSSRSNLYSCVLYIKENGEEISAELLSVKPADNINESSIQFLPYSALPIPKTATELQALIEQCPIISLRQFMNSVFLDKEITLAFLKLPASREHHHAYPGGLAQHSLEVVAIVQRSLWQVTEDEFWLSTAAALLHDIGKIKVFKTSGDRTNSGFILDHDLLTLEILAVPLSQFDKSWPDGAIALRYLLTKSPKIRRPLMPCALAINYADKMSSAQTTKIHAFNQKPKWQRFAKLNAKGPASLFWRPSSSNTFQGVR